MLRAASTILRPTRVRIQAMASTLDVEDATRWSPCVERTAARATARAQAAQEQEAEACESSSARDPGMGGFALLAAKTIARLIMSGGRARHSA